MKKVIILTSLFLLSSCRMTPIGSQPYKVDTSAIKSTRGDFSKLNTIFNSNYALLLLPTQNKIQVFDTIENRVSSSISTGKTPSDISVSPDKKRIIVTNSQDGTISSYFRESGSKLQYLGDSGSGDNPTSVIFNNLGTEAFVAYNGSNKINVLQILVRQKPNVKKILRLKEDGNLFNPYKLAVSEDDKTLFAIDKDNGKLFTFKKDNDEFTQSNVFDFKEKEKAILEHLVYNKDKLYISDSNSNQIIVFDTKENIVSNKIALRKEASNIDLIPTKMALNSVLNKLYVINEGSASVSVVDTSKNELIKEINLSLNSKQDNLELTNLSINNDGSYIYITGASGKNLSIISGKNDSLIRTIGTTDSIGDLPIFSAIKML